MRKATLINQLHDSIEEQTRLLEKLKAEGNLNDEVRIYVTVDSGGYTDEPQEVEKFSFHVDPVKDGLKGTSLEVVLTYEQK